VSTNRFNIAKEPIYVKEEPELVMGKTPMPMMQRSKSFNPTINKMHVSNPTFSQVQRFKDLYRTNPEIPGPGEYQYDVMIQSKRNKEKDQSSLFFRSGSKRILSPSISSAQQLVGKRVASILEQEKRNLLQKIKERQIMDQFNNNVKKSDHDSSISKEKG
jgi:hypothetical protein